MIDYYYVSLVESYNKFDVDSYEKIKEGAEIISYILA